MRRQTAGNSKRPVPIFGCDSYIFHQKTEPESKRPPYHPKDIKHDE